MLVNLSQVLLRIPGFSKEVVVSVFVQWDLRMSYRCLLPFTVLKLLRVLLCYLLSTLMHMGNEREKAVAEARIPTGAPAAHEGGLSHHQVLQRLLQLCCFISLIVAMWGLAVVFVATRPLLKPFNIGQNDTCVAFGGLRLHDHVPASRAFSVLWHCLHTTSSPAADFNNTTGKSIAAHACTPQGGNSPA